MIQKLKALPAVVKWGQIIFIVTIVVFAAMVLTGGSFTTYFALMGVVVGAGIGIVTSLFHLKKSWVFILLDAAVCFSLFLFYLQIA